MFACARCSRYFVEPGACPSCGDALRSVPEDRVLGGRYVREAPLGQGGMARVQRAFDAKMQRRVALKAVHDPSPDREARLLHEAVALGRLRHEHVVRVYDLERVGRGTDLRTYLVMEHIEGLTLEVILREHRERGAHVPVSRAVNIVQRIADGLAAAHAAGVLHRDVKPANVMVEGRTGRPVLIDFGLSRVFGAEDSATTAGTPYYMPPEQIRPGGQSGAPGPGTDAYSLSCVLYELLTGRRPFAGSDVQALLAAHLEETPRPPSAFRPGIEPFDDVVLKGLRKRESDRWQTMASLGQALRAAFSAWRKEDQPSFSIPSRPVDAPEVVEVLIVDDEEVFRKIAARCCQLALLDAPIRVRTADSGERALAASAEAAPHLVLLDYGLPGMSGIDTLVELRQRAGSEAPRIVVASANVGAVERWRFGVLGVSDFIEKPSSLPEMVALLRDIAVSAGWVKQRRAT